MGGQCFGGVKLALKEGSSSGVSYVDVLHVLGAFEVLNKCRIVVRLTTQGAGSQLQLVMELVAFDILEGLPEARRLASQRLIVGSLGPRTMEAAILQALYQLDALMAAEEFESIISHSAATRPKA